MKPRLKPAQLILVGLSGFVICVASLPLTRFVRTSDACGCIRWIPFLLIFGLFVVGFIVILKASSSLKNGIKNQRWPEEQIEPLRSRLESPVFNALPFILLAAYVVLWGILPRYRAVGLACFLLMQVLSQLRTAIRRPPANPSNLIVGWRDLSPIHSDQWGQR